MSAISSTRRSAAGSSSSSKQRPPRLELVHSALHEQDGSNGDISLASASAALPSPALPSTSTSFRPGHLRRASSTSRATSSVTALPSSTLPAASRRRSTLTRANDLPTTLLPPELLARLQQWILCVCVVNFDLDKGPEFDNCYPPVNFTPAERNAIAFSSFPDHNEKGESSLSFSWRLPRLSPSDNLTPSGVTMHGFCHFSQQKNPAIRRGFAQRSLAIITTLPDYAGLFGRLVDILGPAYFRIGSEKQGQSVVVETAVMNICRWPPPAPGTLELAFLNNILLVDIPLPHQAQFRIPLSTSSRTSSLHPHNNSNNTNSHSALLKPLPPPPLTPGSISLLASQPGTPLSLLLRESIDQLWLLWELVVLNEPILVYASDVSRASALVTWLVSIVRPLPFAGEWRPFFHIHTPDFALLLNNNKPRPGLILGSTNPLILSGARHFPHIVRLSSAPHPLPTSSLSSSSLSALAGGGSAASSRTGTPVQGVFGAVSRSAASPAFTAAQGAKHGFWSERKRHVRKDRERLKFAQDKLKAGDVEAADAILLQCMSSLTERFLVPLNRYFATLPAADPSDATGTPRPSGAFNQAHFLQSLKQHGTPLEFRRGKLSSMGMGLNSGSDTSASSTAIAFYERFLKSPNFLTWLRGRTEAVQSTTRDRYLKRLENGLPEADLRGQSAAEVADLLRRLETEVRLTDEELEKTPMPSRDKFQFYDHLMARSTSSLSSVSSSHTAGSVASEDLHVRNAKLRNQVERVKAIRQAALDGAELSTPSTP